MKIPPTKQEGKCTREESSQKVIFIVSILCVLFHSRFILSNHKLDRKRENKN